MKATAAVMLNAAEENRKILKFQKTESERDGKALSADIRKLQEKK